MLSIIRYILLIHTRFGDCMLSMIFQNSSKTPLYEQLYRRIRDEIELGNLLKGERLPSKRALAKHLQISVSTVQNAYAQLLAEGYLRSEEKRGYFVCVDPLTFIKRTANSKATVPVESPTTKPFLQVAARYDLRTNAVDLEHFPYSVWSRLLRETMREAPTDLLNSVHPQGDPGLRIEIAKYLRIFRDINIHPDQIIVGAGIEYIIGLITELLAKAVFAFEDPGYPKIRKILENRHNPAFPVSVNEGGIDVGEFIRTKATAIFVTPSNQFPTGAVMPVQCRRQLVEWAEQEGDNYIIEDDFNSEFHYVLRPIPALYSLSTGQKVIYINSFAQTLAPSLRIAYSVLPDALLRRYQTALMFYSCTVSQFEQLTLKRFLQGAYYERHLNRMRTVYKSRQNAFIESLKPLEDTIIIDGQKAGLHLRIKVPKASEQELVQAALDKGVRVYPFSDYFAAPPPETHTVVAGYAGYSPDGLKQAAELLCAAWRAIP